jgi:type II secretory pathway component GspD/PulD (secretin)
LIAPPQNDANPSAGDTQSKQPLPELKQTHLFYSDEEAKSSSETGPVLFSADSQNLQVNVVDAEAAGLLTELARQMKKTIHFRDIFAARVTVNLAAADPMQVMQQVAALVGGQISVEDGEIWVSRRQNPILRISDTDSVEGADLSTLALGDVLRALGQLAELNIALDVSLDSIKDRPVDVYLQKTSIRRAFETLLKIHALTLKLVDERTLMVMTAEKARSLEGKVVRVVKIDVPFDKLKALLEQSVSAEISARLAIQEDLGNFILTGDKEAVDQAVSVIKSAETKLISAGTSHVREYFQPLNTKPEELVGLVKDSISESENVRLFHDKRTDMILVSGPANSVERAMKIVRRLDLEPTRQALIHIRLIEISRSDLDRMGISFPEQLAAVSDIGKLHNATVVIPATFRGFTENSKVKTLANPTIRCMDREEASIDISEQIPVKNTVTEYLPIASASLAARTSDNWTTSETGIKLNIKPTIHKDNEISMKVDVDLTELIRLVEGHPWTARRVVKTMVRVKDKETVVIGGLIRKKTDKRRNPVPVLSKIPFLRRLVKGLAYRDDNKEESEMVILITPVLVGSGGMDPAIVETSNAAALTTVKPDARN